jgi:hypothetical protein
MKLADDQIPNDFISIDVGVDEISAEIYKDRKMVFSKTFECFNDEEVNEAFEEVKAIAAGFGIDGSLIRVRTR